MEIKFKVLLGEEVVGIKMRIDENIKATNGAPSSPFGPCPPWDVLPFFLCTMGVTSIIVYVTM